VKLRDLSVVIILCVIGGAALVGWASARFLKPDSVPEEISEEILKDITGVDTDFSKDTPEQPGQGLSESQKKMLDELIDRQLKKV
jgi:hypothetical protein